MSKIKLEKRFIELGEKDMLTIVKYWYVNNYNGNEIKDIEGVSLSDLVDSLKRDMTSFNQDTTLDELMFNQIISCRFRNIVLANFNYEGYKFKVKDFYPMSLNEFASFRNVGKNTILEFIKLYELFEIEIIKQ